MMTYKISFLAAALALLFPLWGQGEDISTVSIEKDGTVLEETARAPVSPEAWLPKKVKKESSAQVEDEGLREALLSYFSDSTYDTSLMSYAFNLSDLDGDGREEALVLLESPYTDREGKPELLIFRRQDDGWHMEQEITAVSVPVMVPKKEEKDSPGFRPLYLFSSDDTGEAVIVKLTPKENIYPLAANGDRVEPKEIKKRKGSAFFCSENKKKEPLRCFSLAEEEKSNIS